MSQLVFNKLSEAVKDLLYQSESDESFDVFYWKDELDTFDMRKIFELSKCSADTPLEALSLEEFFKDLVEEKAWYGQDEITDMKRYQFLKEIISNELTNTQVFRVGQTQLTIWILGKSKDHDWFGIRTKAIET